MILTTDLHLSDKPEDEYRWAIFDKLREVAQERSDPDIAILGDVCEKKDRHSSELVNRIVDELQTSSAGLYLKYSILCGNHDKPLKGPPYWSFLNHVSNVTFFTSPRIVRGGLLMLPHSNNPAEEWASLLMGSNVKAIFMHQTIDGVIGDNGHRLSVAGFPKLPRVPIYSGDIHTQQTVNGVIYVGSPHPVDYGDSYDCRILILDSFYRIKEEVKLNSIRKAIITPTSFRDIEKGAFDKGDMLRIRYSSPASKMDQWPAEEQRIQKWAKMSGVQVTSIEVVLIGNEAEQNIEGDYLSNPEQVLREYSASEGLDKGLLEVGLNLLRELP